ncbi:MAG: hypothetical protein LC798_19645 [Chloroflexi bacterium]|nr:hypothetical protein [Chloroflexota bacterium]
MIILDLGPPPTPPLSLNRERTMHHMARHRRLKPWRELAWAAANQQHTRALVAGRPCVITVVLPVVGNYRRDPHNYLPCAKACVDGLVDARVFPDDTHEWVTVNEPILAVNATSAEVRLELRAEAAA